MRGNGSESRTDTEGWRSSKEAHVMQLDVYQNATVSLWSTGSSAAWLSKLTAFSMSRSRQITSASSRGTRRQSKAVVSTRVDSGQLLEVIKGFEPETWLAACLCAPSPAPPLEPPLSNSLQAQPQWCPYFDFGPLESLRHFSSSLQEAEAERHREMVKKTRSVSLGSVCGGNSTAAQVTTFDPKHLTWECTVVEGRWVPLRKPNDSSTVAKSWFFLHSPEKKKLLALFPISASPDLGQGQIAFHTASEFLLSNWLKLKVHSVIHGRPCSSDLKRWSGDLEMHANAPLARKRYV